MSDGEKVTVRPGVVLDGNNDPVPGSGIPFDIDDCVIEPLGSDEAATTTRNGNVRRIRVYAPGPVPHEIQATDEVVVRGKVWRIDGFADEWIDNDPDLSGPVFTASRGTG
ncbi:hypothetical protein GS445_02050 [Rhodococcus hoagii]|uniref:hypothetical protein n=1 Tax=Rhodococcus hoagii TaxID=43767 RepID=UPI00197FBA52|nr:hypothetical protein [Prescottella equi]MBM4512218.1 hypothetical protein [Prescottella equi]MBM4548539.1 hypothetical protein [Prescottella equi]MBM4710908.1 hypothetical protein [Prescottella equi]MBP0086136.1 hypothetical protein [Prescottella equi]NKT29897.1 hypothetical protein [Prescottella equi]